MTLESDIRLHKVQSLVPLLQPAIELDSRYTKSSQIAGYFSLFRMQLAKTVQYKLVQLPRISPASISSSGVRLHLTSRKVCLSLREVVDISMKLLHYRK